MATLTQTQCPNCGSPQLTANKNGLGEGKTVVGAVSVTCQYCGSQFSQEQENYTLPQPKTEREPVEKPIDYTKRRKINRAIAKVFAPIFGLFALLMFISKVYLIGCLFLFFFIFTTLMIFTGDNRQENRFPPQ